MARHRKHRRRRYGDAVVSMPGFGRVGIPKVLKQHVNSTDVLVGAGVGLAGGGLVMYGVRRFWPTAPAFVQTYSGPLSAITAGVGAYALMKKKSRGKATGYLVGAVAIGVVPFVYALAKSALPQTVTQYFGDPVVVRRGFGGMITRAPIAPYRGLLTATPQPAAAAMTRGRAMMRY